MLAASILDAFWMTHLHYCQRTTASENWFLRPAGYDLETDRKRDKWLNGKALNRTAREADQIHYCQLGKMALVETRPQFKLTGIIGDAGMGNCSGSGHSRNPDKAVKKHGRYVFFVRFSRTFTRGSEEIVTV